MKLGNFEVKDTLLVALSFLLVMINLPLGILLVLGFTFMNSSEPGTIKTVLSALLLNVIFIIIGLLTGYFFDGTGSLFAFIPMTSGFGSFLITVGSFIRSLLDFILFLLGAYGFIFALLGKKVLLPGIDGLAGKLSGIGKM